MPTPTIDPMAYEAAYQAVKTYEWNKSIGALILCGIVWFAVWMFKE